jgi:hypothetical protein
MKRALGLVFLAACAAPHTHPAPAAPHSAETADVVDVTARADLQVEVDFFDIDLAADDELVFVLDHSGSMRARISERVEPPHGIGAVPRPGRDIDVSEWFPATAFGRAQKELILTLRELPDGIAFGVVFFGDDVSILDDRLWVLDDDSRELAEAFILDTQPFGGTSVIEGMRAAYDLEPTRIVLVSDGRVAHAGGPRLLLLEARVHIDDGVRIDAVGAGIERHTDVLESLARESGGIVTILD